MESHNIRHLSHLWLRQSSPALCISKGISQTAITLPLQNKRVMQTSFRRSLRTAQGQPAACWVSCSGPRNTHPHVEATRQPSHLIPVNREWAWQPPPSISRFPCHRFDNNKNVSLIIQTELRDALRNVSEFYVPASSKVRSRHRRSQLYNIHQSCPSTLRIIRAPGSRN